MTSVWEAEFNKTFLKRPPFSVDLSVHFVALCENCQHHGMGSYQFMRVVYRV